VEKMIKMGVHLRKLSQN